MPDQNSGNFGDQASQLWGTLSRMDQRLTTVEDWLKGSMQTRDSRVEQATMNREAINEVRRELRDVRAQLSEWSNRLWQIWATILISFLTALVGLIMEFRRA